MAQRRAGKGGSGQKVEFEAVSFEASALEEHPLPFAPPFVDLASNRAGFEFQWRLLTYVFPLRDPAKFPIIGRSAFVQDVHILDRYLDEAREFARSSLLNGSQSVSVNVQQLLDGTFEEAIAAEFDSKEVTRGFAVSFRQFYEPSEPASFNAAYKVVARHARAAWGESPDWDELVRWRAGHGQLRAKPLKVLVGEKLRTRWPGLARIPGDGPPYPEEMISMYQYGDLIHWGKNREDLRALGKSEFDSAWNHLRFLEAVVGLAHLYIGFAGAINTILGDSAEGHRPTP